MDLQLFPAAHAELARKKDHNRAESLLIGLYGVHKHLTGFPLEAGRPAPEVVRAIDVV